MCALPEEIPDEARVNSMREDADEVRLRSVRGDADEARVHSVRGDAERAGRRGRQVSKRGFAAKSRQVREVAGGAVGWELLKRDYRACGVFLDAPLVLSPLLPWRRRRTSPLLRQRAAPSRRRRARRRPRRPAREAPGAARDSCGRRAADLRRSCVLCSRRRPPVCWGD